MAYPVEQLVTRSLILSGIVSKNLQVPTGDQMRDGLMMLNALLDFKQIETDLVPYYTYIEILAVPGQEFYFLPYVGLIESITFNLDVVRFGMQSTSRRQYYGSGRADNITSLPFNWNYNRALGGGNLALYFKPESDYPLRMMVKLFLVDVTLDMDLTNLSTVVPYTFINSSNQGLDTSYIEYLRYALAQYICSEYGILFNPESRNILAAMERKLMYVSPPDLTRSKASILNNNSNGFNWGDVNIGRGWRPFGGG